MESKASALGTIKRLKLKLWTPKFQLLNEKEIDYANMNIARDLGQEGANFQALLEYNENHKLSDILEYFHRFHL